MRQILSALAVAAVTAAVSVAAVTGGPAASQSAPASPFDDAERAALHDEIRAYLLEHPEILVEMYALLEEKQRAQTAEADGQLVEENAAAIFDDGYSYVGGNPEGDVTIVEFLDYQCGFCRRAHPELMDLLESDGNIRWVVKEFPILGPNSELAARAAVATLIAEGAETYARLNDLMMRHSGPVSDENLDAVLTEAGADPAEIREGMEAPEVSEQLAETPALAETLAVSGTPTFVFDTQMVRGFLPIDQMRSVVEEIRLTN
jgi:protein-disulfide isomerase